MSSSADHSQTVVQAVSAATTDLGRTAFLQEVVVSVVDCQAAAWELTKALKEKLKTVPLDWSDVQTFFNNDTQSLVDSILGGGTIPKAIAKYLESSTLNKGPILRTKIPPIPGDEPIRPTDYVIIANVFQSAAKVVDTPLREQYSKAANQLIAAATAAL